MNKTFYKYLGLVLFIAPFISSFILEIFLKMHPCKLCYIERYLHLVLFIAAAFILRYPKFGLILSYLTIISNIFITTYHIGVEYGVLQSACSQAIDLLNENIVNCAIPQHFLGIKLTTINALYSLFDIAVLFYFYKICTKQK